jgi:hypothetical protein
MDKRVALGLVIIVAIVIAGLAFLYHGNQSNPDQNVTGQNTSQQNPVQYEPPVTLATSARDTYINYRNETPSRIFLIDSSATFGTFAADHIDKWDWRNGSNGGKDADRGDRFLCINGTVRNDGDWLLYIALDAHVYDKKGNQIGTLLRSSDRPEFSAAWMGLGAGHSGEFQLLFKLDKQYTAADIGGYDIVLAWEPSATPIP